MLFRSLIAIAALTGTGHAQSSRVGEIEFFGYTGLDLVAVRKAIPVHEGDKIPRSMNAVKGAAKQVTGVEPTDVGGVCCDARGMSMLYIGLGKSGGSHAYNPAPTGTSKFPKSVTKLYDQAMDVLLPVLQKGTVTEDDSKGYALFADPKLHSIQLAMRDYALGHESLILEVLESSSGGQQRIVAAELLGYAEQSKGQFDALAKAGYDANSTVRNNAVRALLVLAKSDPKVAAQIPAMQFIPMLHSGTWTDLNKGSWLLEALSAARDPKLLGALREEALDSLLEMARWRTPGHSYAARMILGRIAGIEEQRLVEMVEKGEVQTILDSLKGKTLPGHGQAAR